MCGRYTLSDPGDLLEELGIENDEDLEPSYNIAPTHDVPVVRVNAEDGKRWLTHMRWGLVPWWANDAKVGARMINARSETAAEKPAFRDAFASRRCLIPADGFYEWKKLGPKRKQPYRVRRADAGPFVFAGLWDRWKGAGTPPLETCTILTTEPNALVAELHDRMPVILPRKAWEIWLGEKADADALAAVLRPFPADELEMYPVGRAVGDPDYDRPDCIAPVDAEPEQQRLF